MRAVGTTADTVLCVHSPVPAEQYAQRATACAPASRPHEGVGIAPPRAADDLRPAGACARAAARPALAASRAICPRLRLVNRGDVAGPHAPARGRRTGGSPRAVHRVGPAAPRRHALPMADRVARRCSPPRHPHGARAHVRASWRACGSMRIAAHRVEDVRRSCGAALRTRRRRPWAPWGRATFGAPAARPYPATAPGRRRGLRRRRRYDEPLAQRGRQPSATGARAETRRVEIRGLPRNSPLIVGVDRHRRGATCRLRVGQIARRRVLFI